MRNFSAASVRPASIWTRARSTWKWEARDNAQPFGMRTFNQRIATLRAMGVHVLYRDGGFVPNEPGQGRPDAYPWHLTLAAAESAISRRDAGRT